MLIALRGDRYQFRHSLLAAYLASLTLKEATPEALSAKAALPAWSEAIAYAALNRSLDTLVKERMRAAPDLLPEQYRSKWRAGWLTPARMLNGAARCSITWAHS